MCGSSPRVRGTPGPRLADRHGDRFIPACAGNAGTSWRWLPQRPVHPRVCGERDFTHSSVSLVFGSSPRVRGTRGRRGCIPPIQRFIPACAGNAKSPCHMPSPRTVHPRVCGEREEPAHPPEPLARFIPACAGNALRLQGIVARSTVHPRVCGERRRPAALRSAASGSSPRVRGTLGVPSQGAARHRFIPACAGNASIMRLITRRHLGSSPRVRGTPPSAPSPCCERRFIPACAGNARTSPRSRRGRPVHPRVCGERGHGRANAKHQPGSSPRVRGTRDRAEAHDAPVRFIPACAGNA